jgi:lipopolysaccharide export system permease protein
MIKNPVFFLINSDTLPAKRIDADWAFLDNYKWTLENAKVNGRNFNTSKALNIKSVLTKDDLRFTSNNPHSLSLFEIPRFIKILEATGIPSSGYKVYFHKILSQPLSYIGVIALAGALIFGKFSRLPSARTITFTIIGSFVYFFVHKLFIALGSSEQMPIILATWIPSVLLLGLGLLLIVLIEES